MENKSSHISPLSLWRGDAPLWAAFWVFGVAPNLALAAAIYVVTAGGAANSPAAQSLILAFAAHTAWAVVAVWRCAPRAEHPLLGQIARSLTVAWALNALLVLTFLEADLLRR